MPGSPKDPGCSAEAWSWRENGGNSESILLLLHSCASLTTFLVKSHGDGAAGRGERTERDGGFGKGRRVPGDVAAAPSGPRQRGRRGGCGGEMGAPTASLTTKGGGARPGGGSEQY